MTLEQQKDFILRKEKEGKVVIRTIEGLMEVDIRDFCSQSASGILYDLNMGKAVVLTLAEEDDPYWVNRFAAGLVIRELKKMLCEKK